MMPSRDELYAIADRLVRGAGRGVLTLVVSIALALLFQAVVYQPFVIPTGSMEPTLKTGDYVFANKYVFGAQLPFTDLQLPRLRPPKRGEVVVFHHPRATRVSLVKRIIGLPGDTIEMRSRTLHVNGEPRPEPYAHYTDVDGPEPTHPHQVVLRADYAWQLGHLAASVDQRDYAPTPDDWGPLLVPPGMFFAMGDNRDNSFDSRQFGFAPLSGIQGAVSIVYFSVVLSGDERVEDGTAIRWERIGHRIR